MPSAPRRGSSPVATLPVDPLLPSSVQRRPLAKRCWSRETPNASGFVDRRVSGAGGCRFPFARRRRSARFAGGSSVSILGFSAIVPPPSGSPGCVWHPPGPTGTVMARSTPLGLLALASAPRAAGHGGRLASAGLATVLAPEEPRTASRPRTDRFGDPPAHCPAGRGESDLRRSPRRRRPGRAGARRESDDGSDEVICLAAVRAV